MGYPSLSAIAVLTTLAEAPMGVALPPMSVPKASAQASGGKGIPALCDIPAITGTMVAAKGILSIIADANAENQRITGITILRLPPVI